MVELISRLKTLRKGAVGLLGLLLRGNKLSNFTGYCAGGTHCLRYLTGISVSYSVGGEGMV